MTFQTVYSAPLQVQLLHQLSTTCTCTCHNLELLLNPFGAVGKFSVYLPFKLHTVQTYWTTMHVLLLFFHLGLAFEDSALRGVESFRFLFHRSSRWNTVQKTCAHVLLYSVLGIHVLYHGFRFYRTENQLGNAIMTSTTCTSPSSRVAEYNVKVLVYTHGHGNNIY